jgi:threonine dehydratase
MNISLHVQDTFPEHRIKLAQIVRSLDVIAPEFLNSPQYNCEPLSEALGCELTIKLDFVNPIRSFKGRGACFLLSEIIRRGDQRALVCASAGNWGQAMAYACRAVGRHLIVYASVNASPLKVQRMKALGAEVRQEGHDYDAAKEAAKHYVTQIGGWLVEDGLESEVTEGHGTIAVELLARGQKYDAVTVPLGNGAMLNGVARWMKAASPATRVLGVSARGADAMEKSWRHKTLVYPNSVDTIADGIAVRVPIPEAVDDMQGIVDDVLLIEDQHIIEAMRLVYQHAGLMLEPAGAVGVAAIVAKREFFKGQKVATVLCGSNITSELIQMYFA